jgi:hypothetical protein
MPSYQYSDISSSVNGMIHKKINNLQDPRVTINRGVRFVVGDCDIRSMKRKSTISPNLFTDIFDYSCPIDLKSTQIVDIIPQINRAQNSEIRLTTPEEFDRFKSSCKEMVAFSDDSFIRKLRISQIVNDNSVLASDLDDATGWTGFGDGYGLATDNLNFVKGNGSIRFGINSAGGTTAGIYNAGLNSFDLSNYVNSGSGFVWVYITDMTNITNFILRVGSGASNYYTKTVTTTNEGTAFYNGWNLLRFDLDSATIVGSPVVNANTYAAIYMTKAAGKINELNYRFDWLVFKNGAINQVLYYSKYGWQTSAGAWIENSTVTTDYVNADTEEIALIELKCAEYAAQELSDKDDVKYFATEYERKKADYIQSHPSEAKLIETTYYIMGGSDNINRWM